MSGRVFRVPGSFRDPAGYVFQKEGRFFRRITAAGKDDFSLFINSHLSESLLSKGQIVPFSVSDEAELTLALEMLPFISYPYEWSFSQLKEAALLTLEIMLEALEHGMILKDASAFNIAFHKGKAVFLDHTSFTIYKEGTPWCAYRQFVNHFLIPLVLMRKKDLRLLGLFKNDLNGIPADLAVELLPWYSCFDLHILFHIRLHAAFEKRYSGAEREKKEIFMSRNQLKNLLSSMKEYIAALGFPARKTLWADYSGKCSYSDDALEHKKKIVADFCSRGKFNTLCDLGAAGGEFAAIAARYAKLVLAADMDPCAVEDLYQKSKLFPNIQSILCDLNNPVPGLGVFTEERSSFFDRVKGDAVMGLALIHHLRITGNWSLEQIVRLFRTVAPNALVEFIPLDDPRCRQLLRGREGLCPEWDIENVTGAFQRAFKHCRRHTLPDSGRIILELND